MQKIIIILTLLLSFSIINLSVVSAESMVQTQSNVLSAREIVEKMDNRYDGDTQVSDTLMVLINKNKKKRVRKIKNYRKDYGEDSKGIIFFLSPADVRDTAYMSFDWDDTGKDDDTWLYLPALNKVKRIAEGDRSGSFMGSDFTYYDINGMEIEDWKYKIIKNNEVVNGHDTWKLEGIPKSDIKDKVVKETGYLKNNLWIRKDNFMLIRGKYWVKKGRKIKYFKADDIKKVEDVWTAHQMTMTTTSKGKVEHTSVFKFSNFIYNSDISDLFFTTGRMEKGM